MTGKAVRLAIISLVCYGIVYARVEALLNTYSVRVLGFCVSWVVVVLWTIDLWRHPEDFAQLPVQMNKGTFTILIRPLMGLILIGVFEYAAVNASFTAIKLFKDVALVGAILALYGLVARLVSWVIQTGTRMSNGQEVIWQMDINRLQVIGIIGLAVSTGLVAYGYTHRPSVMIREKLEQEAKAIEAQAATVLPFRDRQ